MWRLSLPPSERQSPLFARRMLLGLQAIGASPNVATWRRALPSLNGTSENNIMVVEESKDGASSPQESVLSSTWLSLEKIDSSTRLIHSGAAPSGFPSQFIASDSLLYFLWTRTLMDEPPSLGGQTSLEFQESIQTARGLMCSLDRTLHVAITNAKELTLLVRSYHQLLAQVEECENKLRVAFETNSSTTTGQGANEPSLSLADAALAPSLYYCSRVCGLPLGPYPNTSRYLNRVIQTPSWKSVDLKLAPQPTSAAKADVGSDVEVGVPAGSSLPPPLETEAVTHKGVLKLVMEVVKEASTVSNGDTHIHHKAGSLHHELLMKHRTGGAKLAFQGSTRMVKWVDQKPMPRPVGL